MISASAAPANSANVAGVGTLALVGAAGAAARGALGRLALGDLEAGAATAGGDRVRVLDLEAGLLDRLQVVDGGAAQVRGRERVDDEPHAVELELVVALGGPTVEAERVLEAAAAAALDEI